MVKKISQTAKARWQKFCEIVPGMAQMSILIVALVAGGTDFGIGAGTSSAGTGVGLCAGITVRTGVGVVVGMGADTVTADVVSTGFAITGAYRTIVEPITNADICSDSV